MDRKKSEELAKNLKTGKNKINNIRENGRR